MAKKLKALREMSDADLAKELAGLRSQLQDQRFALAGRRFTRVREVRDVKKSIARILTIQKERNLTSNKVEASESNANFSAGRQPKEKSSQKREALSGTPSEKPKAEKKEDKKTDAKA